MGLLDNLSPFKVFLFALIAILVLTGCSSTPKPIEPWNDIERVSIPVMGGNAGYNGRTLNITWRTS